MVPCPDARGRDVAAVALLMAAVVLTFASQNHLSIIGGTVVCGLYAALSLSRAPFRHADWWVFAAACLLFLPAFVKPYHGLSPVFYFLSSIAVFFAAKGTARHSPFVLLKAFQWVYAACMLFIGWVLYNYWGEVEPFGMVIEGSSTNAIPAYLIVVQIGLSLSTYAVRQRLPLVTPFLTAAVAFFGNGRGSLVVAGLIIASTLVLNLLAGDHDRRALRFASLGVAILASAALVLFGEELFEWIVSYTKLSVGLVDTNRLEIWSHYWGRIDPLTLFVGADYAGTVIEHEYRGNPHIAYVRTHSFFGLPLTALALASPLLVLFARKALGAKLVFFTFITLAALRAVSEPIFFPTLLDYFYFSYFFIYFNHALNLPQGATRPVAPVHDDVHGPIGTHKEGAA